MSDNQSSEILRFEMATCWQWRIDTDPELAAALGLLSHRKSTHALDPRSLQSYAQRLEWLQNALAHVQSKVQRDELTKEEQLSYDLFVQQLSDYCQYTPHHKAYLCCVNRLEGIHIDLALYARYLPLSTPSDRAFYLKFLQAIPVQVDEVVELLQTGLHEQRTPCQASMEGVVEQIRGAIEGGLTAFSEPIQGVFPPDEKDLEDQCRVTIQEQVAAAWLKLANFLEIEYIPKCRTETSAVQGYPDGATYYQDCLEFHTTTKMTADEIHNLGLAEVQRVRDSMNAIATEAGYEGRLDEYIEHLRTAKEYEPESAEAYVAHFRDITGRISPAMLNVFHLHTLPKMPFAITEVPASQASAAPAAFYLSGSANPEAPRPGIFYANTSALPTRRTYQCEALALHEAIPGHHTQGSIQGERTDLPDFRRFQEDRRYFEAPCRFPFYTGYIEGWGLHSESLGEELGMYKTRESRMGQLSMEAIRACRLVIDTGIHAKGWSLEKSVQYMLENTATGQHDAESECTRYATWPGQACAYLVGANVFAKLRAKASQELGEKFDKRDLYEVVLHCGPVPLDTLSDLVDEYIDAKQNGVPQQAVSTPVPSSSASKETQMFMQEMTFAMFCRCCTVPGSCQIGKSQK